MYINFSNWIFSKSIEIYDVGYKTPYWRWMYFNGGKGKYFGPKSHPVFTKYLFFPVFFANFKENWSRYFAKVKNWLETGRILIIWIILIILKDSQISTNSSFLSIIVQGSQAYFFPIFSLTLYIPHPPGTYDGLSWYELLRYWETFHGKHPNKYWLFCGFPGFIRNVLPYWYSLQDILRL